KLFVILFLLFSPFAAMADYFSADSGNYGKMTDGLSVDIGNFGASLRQNFDPRGQLISDFIPIEAKVGRFFISALSDVARALYAAFIPFLNMLVAALFAFWIMMESWQMMKSDSDYWGLALRIVKKCVVIVIWLWILNNDPAELFMWLMAPLISLGSGMSDLILNGTARIIGTNLPDTCAAIHSWMADENSLLIGGEYAADLLCLPTRLAGFLYTTVATGFEWMKQGLGQNGLIFIMGVVFVLLFIYNIWKFALAALGIVVDLFFVILFLPFTFVCECFKEKDMKYDGIFAPIFNQLVGFVKDANLDKQFKKFVNVIIYFILLSIVSAICIVLLAGVSPSVEGDFMSILIIGCLVAYLMNLTDKLMESIAEKIDGSTGDNIERVVTTVGKNVIEWGKNAAKIIAKSAGKPIAK
ncbi:MAG: hypothetical protein LBD94_02315, partial [Rickettsiales bacterium]|nr:hypothetical protein [Rickettsiales bacterium]